MSISKQSKLIQAFILQRVSQHPADIVRQASMAFNISRQAVHRHITTLVQADLLTFSGECRLRRYLLTAKGAAVTQQGPTSMARMLLLSEAAAPQARRPKSTAYNFGALARAASVLSRLSKKD